MQDILLGEKRAASTRVLVKIRKPRRISFDSRESSSPGSVSGFLGNSQAVAMVVREEISGPARTAGGRMDCSVARVHDASHTSDATEASTRKVGVMRALTGGAAEHTMLVFRTSNVSVLRESEDKMAADTRHARRAFLSRLGTGATVAGLTVLAEQPAAAQSAGSPEWRPRRHAEDDWLDRIPGVHRFVFDTTSPEGFDAALRFASNYFTANLSGYGLKHEDLAVVIVARHNSTPFAYTDGMWSKHGVSLAQRSGFTDPATKQPPTTNVYRTRLDELLGQGVHLAVCQMATRNLAGIIAKATSTDADIIYKELVSNLLSNAHMVPAGIVAVNRAQERGYSFVHAG